MGHSKPLVASTFVSALILSSAAIAQDSAAHVEACLEATWGYLKAQAYEYGAINTCTYPIAVWFKTHTGRTIQATVEPNHRFRTGLTMEKFETERKTGWIAAVCRVGEVPSAAFADDNWDVILNGKYDCRK